MSKLPKVNDVENFKHLAQSGQMTLSEMGERLGLSAATLRNWNDRLKKGALDAYIEKVRAAEKDGSEEQKVQEKPTRKDHQGAKVAAKIRKLRAQGLSGREIAGKLGVSQGIVWYWLSTRPKRAHQNSARVSANGSGGRNMKITPKLLAKAKKLFDAGHSWADIAEKLDVHKSTLYVHKQEILGVETETNRGEETNGNTGSTAITATGTNKNIFIGYAYCKVEEYIGVLAERSGFPYPVLRSRLAELLGHPEIRFAGRD